MRKESSNSCEVESCWKSASAVSGWHAMPFSTISLRTDGERKVTAQSDSRFNSSTIAALFITIFIDLILLEHSSLFVYLHLLTSQERKVSRECSQRQPLGGSTYRGYFFRCCFSISHFHQLPKLCFRFSFCGSVNYSPESIYCFIK